MQTLLLMNVYHGRDNPYQGRHHVNGELGHGVEERNQRHSEVIEWMEETIPEPGHREVIEWMGAVWSLRR